MSTFVYLLVTKMTLPEMARRLKSLNLKQALPNIVKETSYEMIVLNQQQLYNYGVDSENKRLTPYKSKHYASEKSRNNRRPGLGQPDLFLTGAFYKGFNVVVQNYTYSIDSTDSKSPKLKKQYGENIFGLTAASKKVYVQGIFRLNLQRYITEKTGLKFK